MTNEEKAEQQRQKELSFIPQKVVEEDLIREEGDYFKRQPRVDLSKHSYNYE